MKKTVIILIAVFMLFNMTSCLSIVDGIPQESYDELKAAYDSVVAERDALLRGETLPVGTDDITAAENYNGDYMIRSVSELMNELDGNAYQAKETYNGKKLEITGRVGVIDASGEYISLYPGETVWEFNGVQCFFKNNEQKEWLTKFSVGDTVTLQGKITAVGEILGYQLSIENFVKVDASENVTKFDAESVINQLDVTEYSYNSKYAHYAFLVIKNNSEFDLDISAAVKFYDEKGKLIGAQNASESPFASDSEICLYFMPDEKYATMEYELSVKKEEWYDSVVHDLSYESVSAKRKEIVSVTNNGSEAAEYVEGYALFFNGDNVIGFTSTYFTDSDSELKSGKTISKEMECYEEYTSVRFFFTGRRNK